VRELSVTASLSLLQTMLQNKALLTSALAEGKKSAMFYLKYLQGVCYMEGKVYSMHSDSLLNNKYQKDWDK